jgi:hypothetical protein
LPCGAWAWTHSSPVRATRTGIAHDHLFTQNRAQIVFSDVDEACTFAKETMGLLDNSLFTEGGIEVASMLEMDGTSFRAAVTFPPQMLGRITEVWAEYEKSVQVNGVP